MLVGFRSLTASCVMGGVLVVIMSTQTKDKPPLTSWGESESTQRRRKEGQLSPVAASGFRLELTPSYTPVQACLFSPQRSGLMSNHAWLWVGFGSALAGQFAMFLFVLFFLCAWPRNTARGQKKK